MCSITTLLRDSGIDNVDARVLLRATLGVNDAYLIAHANDSVTTQQAAQFHALAARRAAGEPVAYIVGEREFYGHLFKVSPGVLIPRPETELLVELALARLPRQETTQVLDLGTGSGCIAISIALERPNARVTAVES
jgi:release factor glutamine methyltransferase